MLTVISGISFYRRSLYREYRFIEDRYIGVPLYDGGEVTWRALCDLDFLISWVPFSTEPFINSSYIRMELYKQKVGAGVESNWNNRTAKLSNAAGGVWLAVIHWHKVIVTKRGAYKERIKTGCDQYITQVDLQTPPPPPPPHTKREWRQDMISTPLKWTYKPHLPPLIQRENEDRICSVHHSSEPINPTPSSPRTFHTHAVPLHESNRDQIQGGRNAIEQTALRSTKELRNEALCVN